MSGLNEREEAFEKKYAHEKELEFKIQIRACKTLAQWAAEQLSLTGDAASTLVQVAVITDIHDGGLAAARQKIMQRLQEGGIAVSEHGLDRQVEKFLAEARTHVMKR